MGTTESAENAAAESMAGAETASRESADLTDSVSGCYFKLSHYRRERRG